MVIQEMHYDFKIKSDKVDSLNKRNFNPAEIDWLLNEAQLVVLKLNYGLNNPKGVGFEGIESRVQDLKMLHIKSPEKQAGLTPTLISTDKYEVNLSNLAYEHLFTTRIRATIKEKNCDKSVGINTVQTDDLNDVLSDPHNRPNFKFGKVIGVYGDSRTRIPTPRNPSGAGSLYLYSRNFTIEEVFVDYLKYPQRLWIGSYDLTTDLRPKTAGNSYIYNSLTDPPVSCELNSHMHNEIVDMAVLLAARLIQDPNAVQLSQFTFTNNK